MKTYVITLSQTFLQSHPKAGQPTYFTEKLHNTLLENAGISACDCCEYETRNCDICGHEITKFNKKIHTIRGNYGLWEKRIAEVQAGEAVLSVRHWLGIPYRSKQEEIARLTNADGVGVQRFDAIATSEAGYIDYKVLSLRKHKRVAYDVIAPNDGLSLQDFRDWFKGYDLNQPMAIIHFTSFRY